MTTHTLQYKVSASLPDALSHIHLELVSMLKKTTLDGHVETLLLGILIQRPSYGYRIVQQLNKLAPDVLKMGEGTVYPVLHRMELRALLTSRWETADTGRPRKYYCVSQRGKRQFAAAHQQWSGLQRLMDVVFSAHELPSSKPITKGAMP